MPFDEQSESHGVRRFIAAFNDGIYSVPENFREMNFAKQSGDKSPHSTVRPKRLT